MPPTVPPHRDPGAASGRPAGPEARPAAPGAELWVVDGYNALQVAVLRGEGRRAFWQREARERLVALARRLRGRAGAGPQVRIVFDGPYPTPAEARADPPAASAAPPGQPFPGPPPGTTGAAEPSGGAPPRRHPGGSGDPAPPAGGAAAVEVVFAPSADAYLLALARAMGPGGPGTRDVSGGTRLVAITADRRLAARLRHRGVEVRTPGDFVAACRAAGGDAASEETPA